MKKSVYLFLVLLVFLSLVGCKNTVFQELTADTENANESIAKYYQLQDTGEAEGEYYRAKMLQCVKVHFDRDDYDYSSTVYLYWIAIVPKTTRLVDKFKVQIYPSNEIDKLLQTNSSMAASSPAQALNQGLNSYPALDQTDLSQIGALELRFSISNVSDEWQIEQGISTEDLDKGMTTLRIEIDSDGKYEN